VEAERMKGERGPVFIKILSGKFREIQGNFYRIEN
jgi:hypothetical protein